jgi:MiaB-like tRNA modifying enzyme
MKVGVEAYGCTMSMGEGEWVRRELVSLGHQLVESDDADLVVLNTCMVIQPTENRMLRRIRHLRSKGKRLMVAGCMAVAGTSQVLEADPEAILLPFSRYTELGAIMEDIEPPEGSPGTRAREVVEIVPIAQGCLGSCAYCVTRLARGGLESRPVDLIRRDVKEAVTGGSREIQITAQDTASYGRDIGTDLGELMRSLSSVDGDYRMRVGMMNPDSLSRIIDSYIGSWSSERVFRFLHIPVQSGSDTVLERMGRGYCVEGFLSIVERFRSLHADMSLSTDIIIGFPGETEEDHEASVRLLEEVKPDIVNITRFSPRPGTRAHDMEDQVHGRISKERSRELTDLRFRISLDRNMDRVGQVETCLVTEKGKEDTVVGRTSSYRPVVIASEVELGRFVTVEIVDAAPTHLFGELV